MGRQAIDRKAILAEIQMNKLNELRENLSTNKKQLKRSHGLHQNGLDESSEKTKTQSKRDQ